MSQSTIFEILIIVFSVVIHEVSHGSIAYALGDPTAKNMGRLTINPLVHIDPFGSLILPFLLVLAGAPAFGWAKPVPYNPYNLRNQRWGPALVGIAGPLSNVFVALVFGLSVRFAGALGLPSPFIQIAGSIMFLNLGLAVFNLIPFPPLDGSRVLAAIAPYQWHRALDFLEHYGIFILILILPVISSFVVPVILFFARLIIGGAW